MSDECIICKAPLEYLEKDEEIAEFPDDEFKIERSGHVFCALFFLHITFNRPQIRFRKFYSASYK